MLCKKGVVRNFAKLTGKDLCQSLIFNKVTGLRHTHLVAAYVNLTSQAVSPSLMPFAKLVWNDP